MLTHPDIGVLNSGKCYVFLDGHGLNREPLYGSYEECLSAIEDRGGVDDPIPTDGSYTMADYKAALAASKQAAAASFVVARAPQAVRQKTGAAREYVLTFTAKEPAYCNGRMSDVSTQNVFAHDRKEALRKGRDIIRDCEGPYGRRVSITARLAPM
jgi:hypothetical protein